LNLYKTISGDMIQEKLAEMTAEVAANDKIDVHLQSELTSVDGFVGNFTSTIKSAEGKPAIEYGVSVVATGAQPFDAHRI
jgi:heterodisulfide reductase subunit A